MPSRFALERHRADGLDRPMVHLPNFVPTADAPGSQAPLPISDRSFFLCVGRLEKLKGIQDLLELFKTYREADLIVVGTGSYEAALREQARGLAHVKFLGQLHPSAIGDLYRQAIAVLVPSLCYEVFPLIPAEALAHGTPVIARRIGALTEVIEDSGGGFTFGSLEECRQAMERLRTEPGLRDELGKRGQAAATRHWSPQTHLNRYLELVDSLVECGPRETASGAPGFATPATSEFAVP